MDKGDKVMIYEDPATQKREEGMATLVKKRYWRSAHGSERWTVRFEDNDIRERIIHPPISGTITVAVYAQHSPHEGHICHDEELIEAESEDLVIYTDTPERLKALALEKRQAAKDGKYGAGDDLYHFTTARTLMAAIDGM